MNNPEHHVIVDPGLSESEIQDNVLFRLKFPAEARKEWAEPWDGNGSSHLGRFTVEAEALLKRVGSLARRLLGRA